MTDQKDPQGFDPIDSQSVVPEPSRWPRRLAVALLAALIPAVFVAGATAICTGIGRSLMTSEEGLAEVGPPAPDEAPVIAEESKAPATHWWTGWFGGNADEEKVAESTAPTATPTPPTSAVVDTEEPTWLLCSSTSITYEGGRMRYFKDLSTDSVLGREDFRIRGLQPQQTCVSIGVGNDLEIAKQAKLNEKGQCEVDGEVDPSLTTRSICADEAGVLVSAEMLREHLSTSYQVIDGLTGVTAKCCPGSIFHGCTAPPKPQGPVASNL